MRMSSTRGLLAALLSTLFFNAAPAAGDDPVRVIASDDRGITLRIDLPEAALAEPAPDGRVRIRVPGFDLTSATGLPRLPYASALVALPPGARPSVQVVDAGPETGEDVDLERGPQAVFHSDPRTGELRPDWAPAAPEGAALWPAAPAEIGAPFVLRRQRIARVTLYPWRYDSRARRLFKRSHLTVRVSWGVPAGGANRLGARPAADPLADALFESSLVNADAARDWREPAAPLEAGSFGREMGGELLGGPGFEEDEPEVRVLLDSTGVYALDFAELAAAGYPAGVLAAEVSVHRHEFLEGAAVPYATIEVPSEVDDANGNGAFDAGDRVLIWRRSWAERAGASVPQRAWGLGEVVFVTRVRAPALGLRPGARSAWRDQTGLVPPASFPHREHYERDVDYYNVGSSFADTTQDPFHWTIQAPYYSRDETVDFAVNHLDTTRSAFVTISWQGRSSDTHWNWAQVRNGSGVYTTVVDSAGWSGRGSLTLSRTIFGSSLSEGLTNRWRLWGKTFFGPPSDPTNNRSQAGLNWFQITYGRRYRAMLGMLICNSAELTGEYELLAQGYTDSARIRVYDLTNPEAPVRLTGFRIERAGATFNVRLQDSSAVQRTYAIFDTPRVPPAGRVTGVTRYALHQYVAGDYLLVVPEAFRSAVDPLIQLRESQGLSVVVAPLEGIFDEFNGGRRSSHAIKRFIRYAFQRWNSQFVLLVGDGSVDPRKIDPLSGTDWVPVHRIFGPVLVSTGTTGSFFEAVPSDPWYGWCLSCPDPSLQVKVPDLFVGRLPVNSLAETQAVVAKLVAYEQPQADESWRRRMTLVADDAYSGESFFGSGGSSTYCRRFYEEVFEEINGLVRNLVLNEAGLTQSEPEVFNLSYYLPTGPDDIDDCLQPTPPATDTCRCTRSDFETRARAVVLPELMSRMNSGRLWFNYQGHANERVMSHESFYMNQPTRDDRDLFLNDGRLFLYTGFSCHPNAFAHFSELGVRGTPAFGEDLVTLPGRGAIASWASSGYELLPLVGETHLNVHFARALFSNPVREPYGSRAGGAAIGEVTLKAILNHVRNQPPPSSFENQVGITYTLLGDPATRISLGPPQSAVTANTQPVQSGQPVRLRIGRDSLALEANLATNVRIDTLALFYTGPSGGAAPVAPARYTITPAFPDTSPASGRGRRYHLSFRDTLIADNHRYTIRTVDQNGRVNPFDVVFTFDTVLLADGAPVADLDVISPNAQLSLRVLSPRSLDPATDLTLVVGGPQAFQFTADNGDTSGREWLLTWTHAPYPFGETSVELTADNGAIRVHRFRVNVLGSELRIQNPLAFPNPFEDDLGTHFSFTVESASATDIRIRVYTVSGRLVYERRENGMTPGYQQIAWDGRDAEGDKLANGIYVYRITARNAATTATAEGRLVKLRKPRRAPEEDPVAP